MRLGFFLTLQYYASDEYSVLAKRFDIFPFRGREVLLVVEIGVVSIRYFY